MCCCFDKGIILIYTNSSPCLHSIKNIEYGHHRRALEETKFTFPFNSLKISLKDFFDLHETKGRHRYKTDMNGNGCLFYLLEILKDMHSKKWLKRIDFEKNFEKINLWTENTKFELKKENNKIEKYFIPYGKGKFF